MHFFLVQPKKPKQKKQKQVVHKKKEEGLHLNPKKSKGERERCLTS
jgi:hypothetical protein